MSGESAPPVLLYDGVCGVCNSAVRTILRFDPNGSLRFAALDSAFARAVFDRHPTIGGVDSVCISRRTRRTRRARGRPIRRGVAGGGLPRRPVEAAQGDPGHPRSPARLALRQGRRCPLSHLRQVRHVSVAAAGGPRALRGQLPSASTAKSASDSFRFSSASSRSSDAASRCLAADSRCTPT